MPLLFVIIPVSPEDHSIYHSYFCFKINVPHSLNKREIERQKTEKWKKDFVNQTYILYASFVHNHHVGQKDGSIFYCFYNYNRQERVYESVRSRERKDYKY